MLILQHKQGLGNVNTAFWDSMHSDGFTVGWLGDDESTQLTEYYNVIPITSFPSGFQFQAGTAPTGHKAFKLTGTNDASVILDTGYAGWNSDIGIEFLMKFDGEPGNDTMHLVSKSSYFATTTNDFPLTIRATYSTNTITFAISVGDDYAHDYVVSLNNLSKTDWNHIAVKYEEAPIDLVTLVCNGQVATTPVTTYVPAFKGSRNFSLGGPAHSVSGGVDTAYANNTLWSHIGIYRYGAQPTANILARYALLP